MNYSDWSSALQGSDAEVIGTIFGSDVGATSWAEYTYLETR
jgi:hypothetical protein